VNLLSGRAIMMMMWDQSMTRNSYERLGGRIGSQTQPVDET